MLIYIHCYWVFRPWDHTALGSKKDLPEYVLCGHCVLSNHCLAFQPQSYRAILLPRMYVALEPWISGDASSIFAVRQKRHFFDPWWRAVSKERWSFGFCPQKILFTPRVINFHKKWNFLQTLTRQLFFVLMTSPTQNLSLH